jgi:hypothetical protein
VPARPAQMTVQRLSKFFAEKSWDSNVF